MDSGTAERGASAPAFPGRRDEGVGVLMVHSDELVLLGARTLLEPQTWISRCFLATSADRALEVARRANPRVAVIRGCAPDGGPALARRLQEEIPGVMVMTFGETRARAFIRAVRHAAGGVPEAVLDLGPRLSGRELEVLQHLATGATNGEIGRRLFLSPHTVKQHVQRICRKLSAQNRIEAISRARASGVLE